MTQELFLEIGMEEIPAGFIGPVLKDLERKLTKGLAELELAHGEIITEATPRRLALCVRDLADRQPDRQDEFLGPPKSAAYDADNNPKIVWMSNNRKYGSIHAKNACKEGQRECDKCHDGE